MHKSGFVNIIGNPNVGKSTLMNALVGEKLSIITSKAQTTRHRIMGIVSGEDFQIVYSDTPGILKPSYKLQESMMKFVTGAVADADVILYVTDTVERGERSAGIIDRIRQSRNYNVASACLRQVSFGLLDMAYYTQKEPFEADIIPFEKAAWQKAIIGQQLPQTCMTTQFSHIMAGGYAAGYYSYKWAEVLETDAFGAFQEHGIFDQATAQRFRDCVLSKGGTEHPMTLYKRFRGHEPTIDAMLRRDGIKKQ